MRALVVEPPKLGVHSRAVPTPRAGPGEVRVAVLEGGVCGTDRDIVAGKYGSPPAGSNELILGHENLGRVESVGAGVEGLSLGDLVVATVRRGCGHCDYCAQQRSDFCATGEFTERGIKGRDGFFAEFYVERPEFLVRVPRRVRSTAVLLEPLSVLVKAFRQLVAARARFALRRGAASESKLHALVTGTGAIGLLATLVLRTEGWSVTATARHGLTGSRGLILERVGARYVDTGAGLGALGGAQFDAVVEASGSGALDLQLPGVLSRNGVVLFTGIPAEDEAPQPSPAGAIFRRLVLENQALIGSVNASRNDFVRGVRYLDEFRRNFGSVAESLITERVPWDKAPSILGEKSAGGVKTVLVLPAGNDSAGNVK